MKCTRRGKLPRQDDYATNYSVALSSQWAFQFHTFQIFSLRLFILSVSFVQFHISYLFLRHLRGTQASYFFIFGNKYLFQSISGPYTYLWWGGNTYFNLILFAGGALAVDDKIICLQELCGRDPTFLPLQAKALGGNPSYVLLAFFVFIVVFVSVAPFVLFLPTICAPHIICLCCCFCLCCSLCFVFSNPMCSSPFLSFVFFCIYPCAPQLMSKSSRLEKILRGFQIEDGFDKTIFQICWQYR